MQREEKQLEALLEAVLIRLNDLKHSIGGMIHKLETEYETINWPTFLDNFALISSHLTGLTKILSKDCLLKSRTVLPLKLSPERDEILWQITEGRVPIFSHDIVPDYLRTKPEPAAEQRMLQHEQKANNLIAETAMKQVAQYNKVISHVYDMVSKAREEWENETNSRTGPSQISSMTDTHALVAAVGMGKGLKIPMQVPVPGAPGAGMMVPPAAIRPTAPMSSVSPSGVNQLGKAPSVHLFSMAFYTVRVNEDGKEMESPRTPAVSYRNFVGKNVDDDALSQISNRTTQIIDEKNQSPVNNYKTVRYVNSAAFIEKDIKSTKPEPISSRSTYGSNSNDEDIVDQQYQSHIIMDNDVPLLELNSNESFPSTNTMCYSYRKVCEVTKIIQKPDAYREWLDAKKIAKCFEQQRKQDVLQKAENEKEQRKQLAEEKFKEWKAKKLQEKLAKDKKKLEEGKQKAELEEEDKKNFINNCEEEKKRKESNFKAWLKQKLEQDKTIKERQYEELIIAKEFEKRRKNDATAIFDEWMKTVDHKPKPVPLNRGLFTLKGTISKIYINKNQWVPTDEFLTNTRSL